MGHLAVEDDDRLHALFQGIDAGLDLRDHAVRDGAVGDQAAAILDGHFRNEVLVLVENARNVCEQQEALGRHGARDCTGEGVRIDVVGVPVLPDRHGSEDRNQLGLEYTVMWTVATFYFLINGGGRISLDHLIGTDSQPRLRYVILEKTFGLETN